MISTTNKLLVLVGNSKTGKTSILNRLTKDKIEQTYKETYCCDFYLKEIEYFEEKINLNIWDTSGLERKLNSLPSKLYKQSSGFFIVCSFDDKNSLLDIPKWYEYLLDYIGNNSNSPIVILANKADISKKFRKFSIKKLRDTCLELNLPVFQLSSYCNNSDVELIFYKMTEFMRGRSSLFVRKNSIYTDTTRISLSIKKNEKNISCDDYYDSDNDSINSNECYDGEEYNYDDNENNKIQTRHKNVQYKKNYKKDKDNISVNESISIKLKKGKGKNIKKKDGCC